MANTNNTHSGGIGFAGLLTVLFVGLKLTGYIAWSWVWVLSPLWISFGGGVIILACCLFFLAATGAFDQRRGH